MRTGRCRWKVENETFNTLKNQGYNLEHHYGHGKQHLASVLGMLMILMFLVDQIQETSCSLSLYFKPLVTAFIPEPRYEKNYAAFLLIS